MKVSEINEIIRMKVSQQRSYISVMPKEIVGIILSGTFKPEFDGCPGSG